MAPQDTQAWLVGLDHAAAPEGVPLCSTHADRISVPFGWSLEDDRRPAKPRRKRRKKAAAKAPATLADPPSTAPADQAESITQAASPAAVIEPEAVAEAVPTAAIEPEPVAEATPAARSEPEPLDAAELEVAEVSTSAPQAEPLDTDTDGATDADTATDHHTGRETAAEPDPVIELRREPIEGPDDPSDTSAAERAGVTAGVTPIEEPSTRAIDEPTVQLPAIKLDHPSSPAEVPLNADAAAAAVSESNRRLSVVPGDDDPNKTFDFEDDGQGALWAERAEAERDPDESTPMLKRAFRVVRDD